MYLRETLLQPVLPLCSLRRPQRAESMLGRKATGMRGEILHEWKRHSPVFPSPSCNSQTQRREGRREWMMRHQKALLCPLFHPGCLFERRQLYKQAATVWLEAICQPSQDVSVVTVASPHRHRHRRRCTFIAHPRNSSRL